MRKEKVFSLLVGCSLIFLVGLTGDQILQNVYDSVNTALRVNRVAGGTSGTVTSTGTASHLASFDSATNVTNYGGTGTSSGNVIGSLDAAGAATFVPAGSTNITNVSGGVFLIPNKSSTGTTVNKIAKLDTTASPATAVIATTSDTTNVLGVVVSGAGTTGSATILGFGQAPCQFDNTATVGHFVIVSTSVNGDCSDSGSATVLPTSVAVLGVVATSGTTASPRAVDFGTPEVQGTGGTGGKGISVQVAGSGTKSIANFNATTPAAAANNVNVTFQSSDSSNTTSVSAEVDGTAFTNFAYNGTLGIKDIFARSGNFTVAHRIEYVTTSTSTIVATTPTSPTVGDTYTVAKADSGSGTIVWTRAGSQTLNGATTRTVSAQYKSDTCVYMASNVWICQGDGA